MAPEFDVKMFKLSPKVPYMTILIDPFEYYLTSFTNLFMFHFRFLCVILHGFSTSVRRNRVQYDTGFSYVV